MSSGDCGTNEGFTAEERDVLAKITEMPDLDRVMAEPR